MAQILKERGYKKVKPIWKPKLTPAMKEARLAFTIKYKDWTIEDWKRIIWTDETNVVLGQRRGNHRVWRTPLEGEEPVTSTIQERYHKGTEFMFWGSFSWDWKGPCHYWAPETKKEKAKLVIKIAAMNTKLESSA